MYCGIKIQHLFINGLNYDRVQWPFIDTMLINYRNQNTRAEISNGYSHTQSVLQSKRYSVYILDLML